MPEGVEIYIQAQKFNSLLKGKELKNIKVLAGKYTRKFKIDGLKTLNKDLPSKIKSVQNYGKILYIELDNSWNIIFTFGLVGYLRYDKNRINHDNVQFTLNQDFLFFNDFRNFGNIKIEKGSTNLSKKINQLGPDPFYFNITNKIFNIQINKFKNSMPLYQLLLEQSFVAGIGNYLRADILYYAKLNPFRTISSLSEKEKICLCKSIKHIVNRSYKIQIDGKPIQEKHLIYKKDMDSSGNHVYHEKDKKNRTIWYVPTIQK